jgi:hypothetical protein
MKVNLATLNLPAHEHLDLRILVFPDAEKDWCYLSVTTVAGEPFSALAPISSADPGKK